MSEIKSEENYKPLSFFMKCRLEDGVEVFLECEYPEIKKMDNITPFLTDKSKHFLEVLRRMGYMNREEIKGVLERLVKQLWGEGLE